mgnify:CR=1 FL=1
MKLFKRKLSVIKEGTLVEEIRLEDGELERRRSESISAILRRSETGGA